MIEVRFLILLIDQIVSQHTANRHCHYFQEVLELREGDEIAIAQCAYGGEGDRSWREQLHIENRLIEFDTRIGHLAFIVLYSNENVES